MTLAFRSIQVLLLTYRTIITRDLDHRRWPNFVISIISIYCNCTYQRAISTLPTISNSNKVLS